MPFEIDCVHDVVILPGNAINITPAVTPAVTRSPLNARGRRERHARPDAAAHPCGRTFAFADVSALAGVVLLSAPMWGVAALWWVRFVSLVVLGMIRILRTARTSASPRGAAS